jgi:hypothetical protein
MVVLGKKMGGFQLQPFPALELKPASKELIHTLTGRTRALRNF